MQRNDLNERDARIREGGERFRIVKNTARTWPFKGCMRIEIKEAVRALRHVFGARQGPVAKFIGVLLLACGAQAGPSLADRTKYLRDVDRAAHEETIRSIRDFQHGDFYTVDWSTNADYRLDAMVASGKKGSFAFVYHSLTNLLKEGTPYPGVAGIKFGCSAFGVTNDANDSIVGRSFDYNLPMARVLLHVPRAENRYASVGMVDAGWLNYSSGELDLVNGTNDLSYVVMFPYECMDGMNEKGLTISILALDAHTDSTGGKWVSGQYEPGRTNITLALAIRYLLDRADSTETAVNMLSNFNCFASTGLEEILPGYTGGMESNYHYFIGDRSGDMRVVEWVRPEKPGDSWQLFAKKAGEVTNFYLYDGYGHGSNRWEVLRHALRHRGYKLEEDEVMGLLHGVRQQSGIRATSFTQWSVLYNLDRATARVATLGHYTNQFEVALNEDWSTMDVRSTFHGVTPLSDVSDRPTENPTGFARNLSQLSAVRTLRDLDAGCLWKMRSEADDRRADLMADPEGRSSEGGLLGFVSANLLADGATPPEMSAPVFGTATLLADGTLARLGCGADETETDVVILSLKAPGAPFASINVVNAARFPEFVAGAFTNGVTDLSWTIAFPYFCEAGQNETGLAAALVEIAPGVTFASGAETLAPGLALRLVLDTCDSVSAATNALAVWRFDGAVGLMLADATGATAVFPADAVRAKGDVGDFATAQSDLRKTGYEPNETIDILRTVADASTRCAMSFEPKAGTFSVAPGTSWRTQYRAGEAHPNTRELHVNGIPVDSGDHTGDGWSYDGSVLTLFGTTNYVVSGLASDGSVRIVVAASCDVTYAACLGKTNMVEKANLLVIGNGTAACSVNLTLAGSASFRTDNVVAPIGVEPKSTLNLCGSGTVSNWQADLRGEGEDKGRMTMGNAATIRFVSKADADAAAADVKPVADEAVFPKINQTAYGNRFNVEVSACGSEAWVLDYRISSVTSNAIQQVISSAETLSNLVATVTNTPPEVTVSPLPGFYYGMVGTTNVTLLKEDRVRPHAWYAGQQDPGDPTNALPLTISGEAFEDAAQAFYQLRVTAKP